MDPGLSGAEVALRIAAAADARQGEEIVAIDMRELVSYTDAIVVATARNERLARSIVEEVRLRLKGDDLLALRVEGEREGEWILVDYGSCVLHVFTPATRERYRLDHLWGEAKRIELDLPGAA